MPRNSGSRPDAERVDVRFRNGVVDRGVDPARYRWSLDDPRYPVGYAFDITSWQPSQ